MMWVLGRGSADVEMILTSFVLAACVFGRGEAGEKAEYDVDKKPPRETKAERHEVCDIFKTSFEQLKIKWNEIATVMRTKMGATRDLNQFQTILSKEKLSLDEAVASSEKLPEVKKSFYHVLINLAKFGSENNLEEKHYNRMMMIICYTSSWEIENVLKAFFMSTCSYYKGSYKKRRKRDSNEASEGSNGDASQESKKCTKV